jgi:hypothetical protein
MHHSMLNPFDAARDTDRHHIWQRLVAADSDAFVLGDFSLIQADFDAAAFEGIRCNHSADPDRWELSVATLDEYKKGWLAASKEFLARRFVGISHREAVYRRCRIDRIDIRGDRAVAHKKFSGTLALENNETLSGSRQTLYRLHRPRGGDARAWKVVGFLGQLPLDEP